MFLLLVFVNGSPREMVSGQMSTIQGTWAPAAIAVVTVCMTPQELGLAGQTPKGLAHCGGAETRGLHSP